jgi:SAM-dependent methyltransferase
MFWPDVKETRSFYAGRLGNAVARILRAHIEQMWPDAANERVLALGYPLPYLRRYTVDTETAAIIMPAAQGAVHWPASAPNRSVMAEEHLLPLADHSVDRVLLVHLLEHTPIPAEVMEEMWRILIPGGKILVIVPHRRGLWAHTDATPFGQGRPYSRGQLQRLFTEKHFTLTQWRYGLYLPPAGIGAVYRFAQAWEAVGKLCFGMFGGVLLMEAEKQLFAATPVRVSRKSRNVLLPATSRPASCRE